LGGSWNRELMIALPGNGTQPTALRAAADAERSAGRWSACDPHVGCVMSPGASTEWTYAELSLRSDQLVLLHNRESR
jgi:hypothetical protein